MAFFLFSNYTILYCTELYVLVVLSCRALPAKRSAFVCGVGLPSVQPSTARAVRLLLFASALKVQ